MLLVTLFSLNPIRKYYLFCAKLYISLGIFLKLYNLLETVCIKLDLWIVHIVGADPGPSYEKYMDRCTYVRKSLKELQKHDNLAERMEQIGMMISLFSSASPVNSGEYQHLHQCTSCDKGKTLVEVSIHLILQPVYFVHFDGHPSPHTLCSLCGREH